MIDGGAVRRIAAGSRSAQRELYERAGERIFRLHVRLTGDAALAEDLTHDTFVLLFRKAHQFEGGADATGWVLRVAGNLARERLRTRARREALNVELPRPTHVRLLDPEDVLAVRRAVAELDEPYRLVVVLHYVDGFSHREIGEALDIAEGSSRARLSRALEMLRRTLVPDDEDMDSRRA